MQRILVNDAEIRHLAEPWLDQLDELLAGHQDRPLNRPGHRHGNPADAAGVAVSPANGGLDNSASPRRADRRPAQAVPGRQPAAHPERQQRRDALHHAVVARPDAASSASAPTPRADDATPGRGATKAVAVGYLDSIRCSSTCRAWCSCAAWAAARSPRGCRASCSASSAATPSACARCCKLAGGARTPPGDRRDTAGAARDRRVDRRLRAVPNRDVPAMQPGMVMNQVQIDLDADMAHRRQRGGCTRQRARRIRAPG